MKFRDFEFVPEVMQGLESMGFDECTPVQELAMPVILKGEDIIACAQTGTGKTAAYLIPILNRITPEKRDKGLNTLIIAPTRELVLQIDQQIEGFSYFCGVTSLAIYGGGEGVAFDQQKAALVQGADIIVATPGRLLSHISLKNTNFSSLKHLVLDEADRMLDMGFYDDIMRIVHHLPAEHQTLLFSATMPPNIRKLAHHILRNPQNINIAISKPAENIIQAAYMVYENQKIPLLKQLLKGKTEYQTILIFTSRKANVNGLVRELSRMGFSVNGMNSDLEQREREEVMLRFRNREIRILVATNIVARGIDIESIDLVINFDVPPDAEDYVHRIGRTARAKNSGVAITLISDKDQSDFKRIEELIGSEIMKLTPPVELGESPVYDPTVRKSHSTIASKRVKYWNSRQKQRNKPNHRNDNGNRSKSGVG